MTSGQFLLLLLVTLILYITISEISYSWLLSGDDGEETFHQRLEEDLKKLQK